MACCSDNQNGCCKPPALPWLSLLSHPAFTAALLRRYAKYLLTGAALGLLAGWLGLWLAQERGGLDALRALPLFQGLYLQGPVLLPLATVTGMLLAVRAGTRGFLAGVSGLIWTLPLAGLGGLLNGLLEGADLGASALLYLILALPFTLLASGAFALGFGRRGAMRP